MDTASVMWIYIAIYIIVMFFLGYLGARKTKSISDYSVAKGAIGPVALGVVYGATLCSAIVFLGAPGWAYSAGYSGLWHTFWYWGAGMLSVLILCKAFRKSALKFGSLSLPDWMGHRYNSDVVRVLFALLMLFNLFYMASQFVGMAQLFNTMLGLTYAVGLIFGLVVVVAYITLGGTWADVYTDTVQGIIMIVVATTIFSVGFWGLKDGFSGLTQSLASQDPNLVQVFNPKFPLFSGPIAVASVFLVSLSFGSSGQLAKLFLILKSERDVRIFIITTATVLLLLYNVLWGGIIARGLFPGLKAPDTAVPTLINSMFPPLIAALLGVAILAAIMSTVDGVFVVLSTVFANDIYKRVLVPRGILSKGADEATVDRNSLRIAQGAAIVLAAVTLLLAISPPAYLGTMGSIGVFGVLSGTMAPLVLGLYWKGGTHQGAIASGILGPAVFVYVFTFGVTTSVYIAGAIGILVGVAAMIVVSLATAKRPVPALGESPS